MAMRPAPIPRPDESLHGYLRRLAETWGYHGVDELLRDLGLKRWSRNVLERIDSLEANLPLEPGTLSHIAPAKDHPKAVLNRAFERGGSDPVCPICLEKDGHRRQAWRMQLITCCPTHGVRLVDHCPRCGDRAKPTTGSLLACECGLEWRHVGPTIPTGVEVALSAWLQQSVVSETRLLPPAWQCGLPSDAARFVHSMAAHAHPQRTGKNGKTAPPKTVSESVAFLQPVYAMLEKWPIGFQAYVHGRLTHAPENAASASAALGSWWHTLRSFKDPAYRQFHELAISQVEALSAHRYRGASLRRANGAPTEVAFLSGAEAARRLEVRPERLAEEARSGRIEATLWESPPTGHRQYMYARAEIERVAKQRADFVDQREALNALGVGKKTLDRMVALGLLAKVANADRPVLAAGCFRWRDLEALRATFEAHVARTAALDGTVKLRDVPSNLAKSSEAIDAFFRAAFAGQICPTGLSEDGTVGGMPFCRNAVRAFLREETAEGFWSADEFAALIGAKQQSVTAWCKAGFIDASVCQGARTKYAISHEAGLRFLRDYVPLSALARAHHTIPRALKTQLEAAGVALVGSAEEGAAHRGYLVNVSQLAELALVAGPASPVSRVGKASVGRQPPKPSARSLATHP